MAIPTAGGKCTNHSPPQAPQAGNIPNKILTLPCAHSSCVWAPLHNFCQAASPYRSLYWSGRCFLRCRLLMWRQYHCCCGPRWYRHNSHLMASSSPYTTPQRLRTTMCGKVEMCLRWWDTFTRKTFSSPPLSSGKSCPCHCPLCHHPCLPLSSWLLPQLNHQQLVFSILKTVLVFEWLEGWLFFIFAFSQN